MLPAESPPFKGIMPKTAFFVLGPPASGKSTLSGALRADIVQRVDENIGYVCGDVFSLLSFPWRASEQQLDLKYSAMATTITHAFDHYPFVLIEDLPRRQADITTLFESARRSGANIWGICLTGDPEVFKARNGLRQGPHRMADDFFDLSVTLQGSLEYAGLTKIDAELPEEEVRRLALHEVECALRAPTPALRPRASAHRRPR